MNKQNVIATIKSAANKTVENAGYSIAVALVAGMAVQVEPTGQYVWTSDGMSPVYQPSGISLKDTGKVMAVCGGITFAALETWSAACALVDMAKKGGKAK